MLGTGLKSGGGNKHLSSSNVRQSEICNRVGVVLEHNEMHNKIHYLKE